MQGPLPPTPGTKEKKNKERKTATILQDLVKSGVGTLLRLSQGQRLSQGRRGGVPTAAGPRPRSTAAAPTAGGGRRRRNPHPAAPQPHIPTSRHRDIPASCIPTSRHRDIPAPCSPPALQQPGRIVCIPTAQHPYGPASRQPAAQIYPRPSPGHGADAAGTVLLLLRGPGFIVVSALTGKDNSVTTEVVGVTLGLLA